MELWTFACRLPGLLCRMMMDISGVTGRPQLESLVHSIGVVHIRHKPGLKQANQGNTVSALTSRLAVLSNPHQSFAGCSTQRDAHVTDVRQMHA